MIRKGVTLLVFFALWVALLWFVVGIDMAKHRNVALIFMHILPPLLLWIGWLGWGAWRARKQAVSQAAEADAKRAESEKRHAASRAKFDQELAERRARVEIRWLQVRELTGYGDIDHLTASVEGMMMFLRDEEAAEIADESPDAWPGAHLSEMFVDLLSRCPATLALPIYVLGPSDQAFTAQAEMVRAAREAALLQLDREWPANVALGAVVGLPQSAASPQELIDLCANQPELPGVVVLAFESPLSIHMQRDEESVELSDDAKRREQWFGKAGQALVGMLLTSPALPLALAELDEIAPEGASTVMTPYWERTQLAPGMVSFLAGMPEDWRNALAELPTIAQLRRPAWIELEEKKHRTQNLSLLLERAGVNAALIEPKFDAAADGEAEPPATQTLGDSAWVVHNAGNLDVYGDRLASVSMAMSGAGIALSLTHESTNVVERAGDCGCATPYLMFALAAAKTAELKKPSLVTHFQAKRVAMSFVTPPRV